MSAVISWGQIVFGAGVTAVLTAVVLVVARLARTAPVVLTATAAAAAGPIGWNAILRATHAAQFFTDAPIAVFPASWQDFGSGIFALAAATVLLSLGPLRAVTAVRAVRVAAVCAAVAFLVDIYLY